MLKVFLQVLMRVNGNEVNNYREIHSSLYTSRLSPPSPTTQIIHFQSPQQMTSTPAETEKHQHDLAQLHRAQLSHQTLSLVVSQPFTC